MPDAFLDRRRFLQGAAAAAAGLAAGGRLAFGDDARAERPMPMRALGTTGLEVSLFGLGCHPLGRGNLKDEDAIAVIRRAQALGCTYFDTAPSYGRGRSESRVGAALEKVRDQVRIATKTLARDKAGARKELDASLRRLRTDHVDVWQFHALSSPRDIDRILGKGGAMEAALEARKAGKVRHIGITGHADPAVFVDAMGKHAFDTLLIPLNCIDPHHRSFERNALPVARKGKLGVVAMKVFCSGKLPAQGIVDAESCLRYTYGLPISTCIVGADTIPYVELAARVAREGKAMDDTERARLLQATKPHSPKLEWYKRKD